MKTIFRRLRLLEEKVANHELVAPNWADVLLERRRLRLEASGLPYEEPWQDPALYANGRRPTWAQVLQSHQAHRCAEAEALRARSEP